MELMWVQIFGDIRYIPVAHINASISKKVREDVKVFDARSRRKIKKCAGNVEKVNEKRDTNYWCPFIILIDLI